MICLSQPALLSAVWYTLICAGPVCWYRGLAITPSAGQYLLYLLSDDLLSPISTLPSPAPAPAILTPISRASLVPAIALADILPRGCNHHNVGGNIKRKWQMVTSTTAWTFAIISIWLLMDKYFKSPCSLSLLSQCQIHILISSAHIKHSIDQSDSDTSHHNFIYFKNEFRILEYLLSFLYI